MISISSDDPVEELNLLEKLSRNYRSKDFISRSPLDLYLREKVSWWIIESPPAALFVIYNKPFRDLKIIAEIRKIPEYQWIPIILIVKEHLKNLRIKFLEVGVTEVIEKPETENELLALIDLFLRRYSKNRLMAG